MNTLAPVVPGSPDRTPDRTPGAALGELQRQFVREILYRDSTGLHSQVVVNGLDPQRRLAIYRANARENVAQALEAAYPLLLCCMGRDEFRRLAWAYQQAHPSPSGNLFHLGARLPGFLGDHLPGTEDEHLIDVARLEWVIQEALVAADGPATLDLAALAAVPAERQAHVRFLLHPSVRLLRTRYGVFGPWEARQAGRPVAPPVPAAEYLLVRRQADGIQLQRLGPDDFAWLSALEPGAALAQSGDEQGDSGSLLVRWVGAGVITAFALDDPSSDLPAGAHSA